MKRLIIYARVSTKDEKIDMQLNDLREYLRARKLNVIKEYIELAERERFSARG